MLCSFHVKQKISLWAKYHLAFSAPASLQSMRRSYFLLLSPPVGFLLIVADASIAVHHRHFELTFGGRQLRILILTEAVHRRKHLTDFHKGFVPGLRNDEDGVERHCQADGTEDQVAVWTCCNLGSGGDTVQLYNDEIVFHYKAEVVYESKDKCKWAIMNPEQYCHSA